MTVDNNQVEREISPVNKNTIVTLQEIFEAIKSSKDQQRKLNGTPRAEAKLVNNLRTAVSDLCRQFALARSSVSSTISFPEVLTYFEEIDTKRPDSIELVSTTGLESKTAMKILLGLDLIDPTDQSISFQELILRAYNSRDKDKGVIAIKPDEKRGGVITFIVGNSFNIRCSFWHKQVGVMDPELVPDWDRCNFTVVLFPELAASIVYAVSTRQLPITFNGKGL